MKYRPDYPQRFASKDHALTWARAFFPWYNQEHHHVALGLLTPAMIHLGQLQTVLAPNLKYTQGYATNRHAPFINISSGQNRSVAQRGWLALMS